jgi:hypothetical protein
MVIAKPGFPEGRKPGFCAEEKIVDNAENFKRRKMPAPQTLGELERELAQLQAQLPRHSIKPSTLARIDELEEEIARLKKETATEKKET